MTIVRTTAATCVLLASLCCAQFAPAATNSAARVVAWSKLEDWSGLWEMGMGAGGPGGAGGMQAGAPAGAAPAAAAGGGMAAGFGPSEDWPFSAAGRAKYQATQAALDQLSGEEQMPDTTVTECTWGFPRVLSGPYMFAVTVTPELVFFNYDIREFRHIWTDGRKHPAKLKVSSAGHSIGYWQDDTLVVDTVGADSHLWITGQGMMLSDQAHFTERWRMQDGVLNAEVTIDDPVLFTKPYVLKRQFKRITDTQRIIQQNCFEDVHEVKQGDKVITKFAVPSVSSKQ